MDKKIIIYVLYFNDETKKITEEKYSRYKWAKPLYIETTEYFENVAYKQLYAKHNEWTNADYVGTIAYSAFKKINIDTLDKFLNNICDSTNDNFDVIALRPMFHLLLFSYAKKHHPQFEKCWDIIFNGLNYNFKDKSLIDEMKAFYCNYWIAKPSWMSKYITIIHKIFNIINNNEELKKLLWMDAKYRSKKGNLFTDKYKINYYPHHPFVLERVPAYYFNRENAYIGYFYGSLK